MYKIITSGGTSSTPAPPVTDISHDPPRLNCVPVQQSHDLALCQKWYDRTTLIIYDRTTLRMCARTVCGMAFLAWARFLLKPRWHQICREIPVNTSNRSQKSKVRSQIWSIACLCSYSGSQSVILYRDQSKCFIQPKMILCTNLISVKPRVMTPQSSVNFP